MVQGRRKLLSYLKERTGLHARILHVSYGNPIMVAETISNFPTDPKPGVVYDFCFWARLATYHMSPGGLVDRVTFLENGALLEAVPTSRVAAKPADRQLTCLTFRPLTATGDRS